MKSLRITTLLLLAFALSSCLSTMLPFSSSSSKAMQRHEQARQHSDVFSYLAAVSDTPVETDEYIFYPYVDESVMRGRDVLSDKEMHNEAFSGRYGVKTGSYTWAYYVKQANKSKNAKWATYINGQCLKKLSEWVGGNYPQMSDIGHTFFEYDGKTYIYSTYHQLDLAGPHGSLIFKPEWSRRFIDDYAAAVNHAYLETEKEKLAEIKSSYGKTFGMSAVIEIFEDMFAEYGKEKYKVAGVISCTKSKESPSAYESVVRMQDERGRHVKMMVRTRLNAKGEPDFYERFPLR